MKAPRDNTRDAPLMCSAFRELDISGRRWRAAPPMTRPTVCAATALAAIALLTAPRTSSPSVPRPSSADESRLAAPGMLCQPLRDASGRETNNNPPWPLHLGPYTQRRIRARRSQAHVLPKQVRRYQRRHLGAICRNHHRMPSRPAPPRAPYWPLSQTGRALSAWAADVLQP